MWLNTPHFCQSIRAWAQDRVTIETLVIALFHDLSTEREVQMPKPGQDILSTSAEIPACIPLQRL